jgi:hypothetical protein
VLLLNGQLPEDEEISSFIKAFESIGYKLCDNDCLEEDKLKVALYSKPGTDICTHAARQLRTGKWTSKLGASYDIQHASPYTLQGRVYGTVNCILYRKCS